MTSNPPSITLLWYSCLLLSYGLGTDHSDTSSHKGPVFGVRSACSQYFPGPALMWRLTNGCPSVSGKQRRPSFCLSLLCHIPDAPRIYIIYLIAWSLVKLMRFAFHREPLLGSTEIPCGSRGDSSWKSPYASSQIDWNHILETITDGLTEVKELTLTQFHSRPK